MDDNAVQQSGVLQGTEPQLGETSTKEVEPKQGEPSVKGEPSKQSEVSQETESQKQLLTREQVKEMIEKSLADERWKIKRSVEDKTRVEVEKALQRANLAETTLRGIIPELDEETKTKLELQQLRGQAAQYQTKEQEEAAKRQYDEFHQTFNAQMEEFITEAGVDPTDKRIDWAKDAKDAFEVQKRVLSSVNKIQKESSKAVEDKRSQDFKNLEAKLRKELGLDSVDTTNPVSSTNEQTWLEKWGNGDIEATPQNLKKAMTLQKKLYGS